MTRHQVLRTDGSDELVVLTRAEYDALLAAAGDEEAEQRAAERIVSDMPKAADRGGEILLPEWLAVATARGETPFEVVRRHLGRSKEEVARTAGITVSALSALERGAAEAPPELRARIAAALDVDFAWLED